MIWTTKEIKSAMCSQDLELMPRHFLCGLKGDIIHNTPFGVSSFKALQRFAVLMCFVGKA